MRNLIAVSALSLLLGATGCVSPGPTVAAGEFRVELINDGTVTLRDVVVRTGEEGPAITDAELGPGEVTPSQVVGSVHQSPGVTATVNGVRLTLHPIEGFVPGWNPLQPPGPYVVRLRYDAQHGTLAVAVEGKLE